VFDHAPVVADSVSPESAVPPIRGRLVFTGGGGSPTTAVGVELAFAEPPVLAAPTTTSTV
jgi:hypothetical protein